MTLPRLTGARVALVPVTYDVAVAVVRGQDPGPALSRLGLRAADGWPLEQTVDALRPLTEHSGPDGNGGWLVAVDREVVGDCGWRSGVDPSGAVEVRYGVAAPSRGQGVGTEAVAVLCAWTEQQPGVRAVVAEALLGNEPSRRLLQRLGFDEQAPRPPYSRWVRGEGYGPGLAPRRIRGRHVC